MNIEIKRLGPGMAEDYVHFFDVTPHDSETNGEQCYCVAWAGTDNADVDLHLCAERRKYALKYVQDGSLQGYLAYLDGEVVGWCNANDRSLCLNSGGWRWMMGDAPVAGARVKSVFCFVIKPELYRRGIATRLLERVCADAAAEGFEYVEAYPRGGFAGEMQEFMGPVAMYENLGFEKTGSVGDRLIMRKKL